MTDSTTELASLITFLDTLASRLEGWANESRLYGWSTHQVDANRATADECRRKAAGARLLLARMKDSP